VASLGALSFATASLAQGGLGRSLQQLEQINYEITRLESEYRVLPSLGGDGSFEDRLNYGRIFLDNGNYEQASLFLFGAVNPPSKDGAIDPAYMARPGYAEAVYALAEALYQLQNYEGARRFFQRLLTLDDDEHHEKGIKRLIDLGAKLKDFESVDKYYDLYLKVSKGRVPDEVRYLRGRSLFLSRRDKAALVELEAIRPTSMYGIRAQYLIGAVYTRAGSLDEALKMFEAVSTTTPKTVGDRKVTELAHLARGRLFFEQDRLAESIAAYQNIEYDSDYLAEMLYEITWAYVRRGQLAYKNTEGNEEAKLRAADGSFVLAIEQLSDLKAVEPDSERAADITILMGNLRLQRNEFDEARLEFEEVLDTFQDADDELRVLMKDASKRERILQDILTLESGGQAFDTQLPPIVARKAVDKKEVADAIRVFKDIEASRAEIEATERMLVKLEQALAAKNKDMLFRPVAGALSRSKNAATVLLRVDGELAQEQHAMVQNVAPEKKARLEALRKRREALEAKLAGISTSGDDLEVRATAVNSEIQRLERMLHEAELELATQKKTLGALDQLFAEVQGSPSAQPRIMENMRLKLRDTRSFIEDIELVRDGITDELEALRTTLRLSGGRGQAEGDIREAYKLALDREQIYLAELVGPAGARLTEARAQVRRLQERNDRFKKRVDDKVAAQMAVLRLVLEEERAHLLAYRERVEGVNAEAADYKGRAAAIALDHVRADLNNIVVRADVGMIDVAFRQKQLQTERIGKLQRQKAIELTDLNQAYADLNQDDAQ